MNLGSGQKKKREGERAHNQGHWKPLLDLKLLMKNGGVENYKFRHDLNFLGPYEPRRRSIIRCKKEENYEDNSQMDESLDSSHSPVDEDMFEINYTLSRFRMAANGEFHYLHGTIPTLILTDSAN
uniref:Uncharacterized protein n=1 Tax=Glossina morsitans morsitans TaxID=37546 RepID=A0A1B0FBF8_GLOMM